MIRSLSETLHAILTQPQLPAELAAAQIMFDRPVESNGYQQTTINLFLYDIRENVELRNNEPIIVRQQGKVITHRPPLRVSCSYLITAWPFGGQALELQEQRLLSQVLEVLSRYNTIPGSFLQGKLVGQEPPLPMVTLQLDAVKNLAEFWSALGAKIRPSITVTVTISMTDITPPVEDSTVISAQFDMELKDVPATKLALFRIGGLVIDANSKPIANAIVSLLEAALTTASDDQGRFVFGKVAAGAYTLRAQSGLKTRDVAITVPAAQGNNYDVQII